MRVNGGCGRVWGVGVDAGDSLPPPHKATSAQHPKTCKYNCQHHMYHAHFFRFFFPSFLLVISGLGLGLYAFHVFTKTYISSRLQSPAHKHSILQIPYSFTLHFVKTNNYKNCTYMKITRWAGSRDGNERQTKDKTKQKIEREGEAMQGWLAASNKLQFH